MLILVAKIWMDDLNKLWPMWSNMIFGQYFLVMPPMPRVMVNDCWRSCLQSVYDVFTMWLPLPGRVHQAWALELFSLSECFEKARQGATVDAFQSDKPRTRGK